MLSYYFRHMHVQYSMTYIKVTSHNYVFFVQQFGTVFVKYFLKLIDFIFKSLKILASSWYVSSNEIKFLELQSKYTTLLTELSFLKVLKGRNRLELGEDGDSTVPWRTFTKVPVSLIARYFNWSLSVVVLIDFDLNHA